MPSLRLVKDGEEGKVEGDEVQVVQVDHETLGKYWFSVTESPDPSNPEGSTVRPELLFTDNDTNLVRTTGGNCPNQVPFVKDAFHDHIIPEHRETHPPHPKKEGEKDGEGKEGEKKPTSFVNPEQKGTKCGAHYKFENVPAEGGCAVIRLKLSTKTPKSDPTSTDDEQFDQTLSNRISDADEFYSKLDENGDLNPDLMNIMRQALGGMLWTKQFYYYVQKDWLNGDPGQPEPPKERRKGRNKVGSGRRRLRRNAPGRGMSC